MATSGRAVFFSSAWYGFRGVKKGLAGALLDGGVYRQSFTHSCRVTLLRAARSVTRFGLSVFPTGGFVPLPPPSQKGFWSHLGHGAQARQFSELHRDQQFPHSGWVFWLPLTIASICLGLQALDSRILGCISCCIGRPSLICVYWSICCGSLHWRFTSVGSLCLDILGRFSTSGGERRRLRAHL